MKTLELFEEKLLLKNMSNRTIQSYIYNIKLVSKRIKKEIHDISEEDIKKYILKDKIRLLSSSSQMMIINSFKAYYREILNRKFDHDILPRPKMEQKQPDILSTNEIQMLIDSIDNLKHKSIIALMYSCALRVSELLNIKVIDIDSKNNKLNIRCSKGKIDRIVMLDKSILELLRKYWALYKTNEYLFEGAKGDKYSESSVNKIVKENIKTLGIKKRISTHSLRHSCLTQLIKNGVDLRTVQKIAGHKNINTTAGYIKIIDSDILETVSPITMIKL